MKRITLLKPHTHDGVAHASGISLELPNIWADWLVKHGIATPAPAAANPSPVTVPAPRAAATAAAPAAAPAESPAPPAP